MTDTGSEYGRLLAERDRLIADGADPSGLEMPLRPLLPAQVPAPELDVERLARAMVAADETMFGHGFDELSELSRESRLEHAHAVAAEYHALGVEDEGGQP